MRYWLSEIKDFPGYHVSRAGEVYSSRANKMRLLKQYPKTHGYLYVALRRDDKRYYRRVHRLVAEAFIPNPDNLPEVNHKDEDKTNNFASNLEWCTAHDNKVYGSRRARVARKVSDPSIPRKNNTSGRKGVTKTRWNTWVVYFNRKYLGTFKTFEEAVSAREKAETEAYNYSR